MSSSSDGNRMSITLEQHGGTALILARGELHLSSTVNLRKALLQALESPAGALLDLAAAQAIDLAFLQLLVAAHKSFAFHPRRFQSADPSRQAATACRFADSELPPYEKTA